MRGQNFIDVEIALKNPNERSISAQELMELWRNEIGDIPGVDQMTFEAERGPGGGWRQDIVVDLSHSDVGMLESATEAFVGRMEGFAASRNVNDNYESGKKQLDFQLLPEGRKLGLAMLLIYALLAVAFSSYIQPLIVMGAIPFGIVGGVIGHILLGYDLSLVSLMGVIALSGVVLNDSLIMVDYANKKRSTGLTAFQVVKQAGLRRSAPSCLPHSPPSAALRPSFWKPLVRPIS